MPSLVANQTNLDFGILERNANSSELLLVWHILATS